MRPRSGQWHDPGRPRRRTAGRRQRDGQRQVSAASQRAWAVAPVLAQVLDAAIDTCAAWTLLGGRSRGARPWTNLEWSRSGGRAMPSIAERSASSASDVAVERPDPPLPPPCVRVVDLDGPLVATPVDRHHHPSGSSAFASLATSRSRRATRSSTDTPRPAPVARATPALRRARSGRARRRAPRKDRQAFLHPQFDPARRATEFARQLLFRQEPVPVRGSRTTVAGVCAVGLVPLDRENAGSANEFRDRRRHRRKCVKVLLHRARSAPVAAARRSRRSAPRSCGGAWSEVMWLQSRGTETGCAARVVRRRCAASASASGLPPEARDPLLGSRISSARGILGA